MISRRIVCGGGGGGGGGDGDGERAFAGFVERGLLDEAGFDDDAAGAGGTAAPDDEEGSATTEVDAEPPCEGAGDGECTTTGIDIGTCDDEPSPCTAIVLFLLFTAVAASEELREVAALAESDAGGGDGCARSATISTSEEAILEGWRMSLAVGAPTRGMSWMMWKMPNRGAGTLAPCPPSNPPTHSIFLPDFRAARTPEQFKTALGSLTRAACERFRVR